MALGKLDESSALCVRFCGKFPVCPSHRRGHARELSDFQRSGTLADQFDDGITHSVSAVDVRDLHIRAGKRDLGPESLARGDEDFFRSLDQCRSH